MDISHILDELNDPQREAVTAESGPLLVLAGAGSGKTRALTSRIAWLVDVEGYSPMSILAVTFTNKAAREVKQRVEGLLGYPVNGMWMGTFHGICYRLLRAHHEEAGLPQLFEIMDSDDQHRLVKRIMRDASIDEGQWPAKQVQWFINGNKEDGRRSKDLPIRDHIQHTTLKELYRQYEEHCEELGLVDFAELLLRTVEVFDANAQLRLHYQRRFGYILVDEFQDTNMIQYRLIRQLVNEQQNILAVGDDDQSIYGWRGARVENILQFEKDFKNGRVIRLEQNYRSTGTILKCANAVIDQNKSRLGKTLWTANGEGDKLLLYTAYNETDEAKWVIDKIETHIEGGASRADCAILYRSNAQSRVFEEQLIQCNIPYRVYGGLRFFERAEIRDTIAYLKLVYSPDSDVAFERAVNMPPRGIGSKTLEKIREQARLDGVSLYLAAETLLKNNNIRGKAASGLLAFRQIIETHQQFPAKLAELLESIIRDSKLREHYEAEKGERGEARIENLQELVSAASYFSPENPDDVIGEFLANAALDAGDTQSDEWQDSVQLMSLHSAKGLEFPFVFVVGLEEGLFPHQRCLDDPRQLEEERRLCYVGMTRAMQQLCLSWAQVRRLYGRELYPQASRFIAELPDELVDEVRPAPGRANPGIRPVARENIFKGRETNGYTLGGHVRHAKFGDGVILNLEGQGEHARAQVSFKQHGSKWLVLAYAKLEKV